jgi:hypothetical protein
MIVPREFVGGPLDGECRLCAEGMREFRFPIRMSRFIGTAQPSIASMERPLIGVYRLGCIDFVWSGVE